MCITPFHMYNCEELIELYFLKKTPEDNGINTLLFLKSYLAKEEFEDTRGVIEIRKSKKVQWTQCPKEKGQKDKQRSTKHYREN